MPQCQQCSQQFTINTTETRYYTTYHLPAPTSCSKCRLQLRLAWRNESVLYSRSCDLCHQPIISTYSTDKPFPVYCQDCFWSDKWDALAYGQSFDANIPFFTQLATLFNRVPHLGIINKQSENSDYCNYSFANKSCYLTFGNHYEENCLYGRYSTKNKDCVDYLQCYQNELCYQCLYTGKSYHCSYLDHCTDCQNCYFSFDLKGCKDCLFSANLRNKQYCIFNQPYSEEEYEKILQSYQLHTFTGMQQAIQIYREQVQQRFPIRASHQVHCEQCTGNNLQHSKNLTECFDANRSEDCVYGVQMDEAYTSMDVTCMGYDRSELCYQTIGCTGLYNAIACSTCWHSRDMFYSCFCFSSTNCFGSISLQKQEYCLLNTKYNKTEYERLTSSIREQLQRTQSWGNFLPAKLSPFGYNETVAFEHFPLTEDEATQRGYHWYTQPQQTQIPDTYHAPDTIQAVNDDILNATLHCTTCQRLFRIVRQELNFYRQLNIPVPHECPDCRARQRLAQRNPMQLWQRQCMCQQTTHGHTGICSTEFTTSYAPNQKVLVYCEKCYQQGID